MDQELQVKVSGSQETLAYSTRSIWSSETLVAGMETISKQPCGLLVKTEEDAEMVEEYNASWMY